MLLKRFRMKFEVFYIVLVIHAFYITPAIGQGGAIWSDFGCPGSTKNACPVLPSTTFMVPAPLSFFVTGSNVNRETGLQIIDINNDQLPDLVMGHTDAGNTCYACVYINAHCGWVLQV